MTAAAERDNILGRIRQALRVRAPEPHSHTNDTSAAPSTEPQAMPLGPSDWLPLVGGSFDERVELFARNAADLRAEFILSDPPDGWIASLREAAIANDWKKVAAHRTGPTEQAVAALGLPVLWTDGGYDVHELERCDVGITACDALVAQTGSVLVSSRSAGGRGLSVLPPHHVVIARREQMIADLPGAFALLKQRYAPDYPSFISLITGPSRTGDIERILVLGAHGPRKLSIFCT